MANNRLYLLDTEENECFLLAKGWGTWALWPLGAIYLGKWLDNRDFGAATGVKPTVLKLVTEDDLPKDVTYSEDCSNRY